jgi:Tfp pilus assembly PilM family ATPase
MHCGMESITLVEIDGRGIFVKVESYAIQSKEDLKENVMGWLRAFAKAVSQIPKATKKRITLIVPPNDQVFIKHIQIPEVTEKSIQEAFKFECEHNFPGGTREWCLDIYWNNDQTNHALGIAIPRAVSEQMVDILIRNKIDFSYICPEIVLNTIAIQKYADSPMNSMLVYMGENSSYLTCIGNGAEYSRSIPITGIHLIKTITESQKVSFEKAKLLLLEFFSNQKDENRAFMTYYLKQFSQKLRQEIKKSELFYCRTLKQHPIKKLYLTGNESYLYDAFNTAKDMVIINMFDTFKHKFTCSLREEEIVLVKNNIGVFIGAVYCLNSKQVQPLKLFSVDFSTQIEFQRQNFGYLLIFIVITLALLTGLKILKKDAINLETKKSQLEAKLLEVNADIIRYEEAHAEHEILRSFIVGAKLSLYSQAAWADLFNEIQCKMEHLKTAWIESLTWADKKDGNGDNKIKVSAKIWINNGETKRLINKIIEELISSLGEIKGIDHIENIQMSLANGDILPFSFDVILGQQSEILVR